MDSRLSFLPAVGRILLSLIFVIDGFAKISTPDATAAQMASHGIPFANVLVWAVIVLEFVGGLVLLTGLFARWIALIYAFYLAALAVMFHPYWAMPAAEMRVQHAAFYEHIAMIGGMLYVVAFGAGRFSLDALLGRWKG